MQNRYVPDLGDFSKFGLLRVLSGVDAQPRLRVGLVWYLTEQDEANNDGRHTAYLELSGKRRDQFRDCDAQLYDTMAAIHAGGVKDVRAYRKHGVLPGGVYFEQPLVLDGRLPQVVRDGWLIRAYATVRDCDLVMLDPDNGLEVRSVAPLSRRGSKYATLDECRRLFDPSRRSLVVYQHATRRGTVVQQADRALSRLAEALGVSRNHCFALRFRRGTSRLYLIASAARHAQVLPNRAEQMIAGPWGRFEHFELIR